MEVASKPEQLGWMVAIQNIEADPKYKSFPRIGVIVDLDVKNLRRYNDRTLPIYQDWVLPDRYMLVYASADVGSEYLANKIIKSADSAASQMLRLLEEGYVPLNPKRFESAPFAALRRINPRLPPRAAEFCQS